MENNQKYVLKAARKMERDMKRYGGLGMAVFLRHRNLEDYIRDEIADASENQGWISAARRAAEKIRCENPGLQIKVDDMADQVAEILKGQGIRGRGGRVLTAATIKRESLRSTNCKKNSIKPLVGVKPP